jgi:outer membrane protein OmpA-like peptidoglycan-associated protein
MKNIKKFNEFVDLQNEGVKDWVAGAGLLASTLLPNKATAGVEPGDTLHKVTKSKSEMEQLVKYNHWTLDSTKVDTLYQIIKKKAPETKIYSDTITFGVDGELFLTGKFELNSTVISGIMDDINSIGEKGGTITDFQIESSTDKEPIKMGNDVLAQKRADVIKNELIKNGVDPSLISIQTLPEQGPDLYKSGMNSDERVEARKKTSEFRYVKVRIVYILNGDVDLPAEYDTIMNSKKTYYLSKPVTVGTIKPRRLKNHFKKTTVSLPIKNTKRSNGRTDCPDWGGKKGWWNSKKLGYE